MDKTSGDSNGEGPRRERGGYGEREQEQESLRHQILQVCNGLTIIRIHLTTYFLLLRGRSAQKAAWREFCRPIRHLGSGVLRFLG